MRMQFLFDTLFFGFAIYSFLYLVTRRFAVFKKNDAFKKIESAALTLIGIAGILYALTLLWQWTSILFGADVLQRSIALERLSGPYGFSLWLPQSLIILATQLLWIKKIAQQIVLRLFIACILFVNFEKFVILMTSIHRDYLPSSWSIYGGYSMPLWIVIDWALKLIIFSSFVTVSYYLKNRKRL